jgi:hypothetical protein
MGGACKIGTPGMEWVNITGWVLKSCWPLDVW